MNNLKEYVFSAIDQIVSIISLEGLRSVLYMKALKPKSLSFVNNCYYSLIIKRNLGSSDKDGIVFYQSQLHRLPYCFV